MVGYNGGIQRARGEPVAPVGNPGSVQATGGVSRQLNCGPRVWGTELNRWRRLTAEGVAALQPEVRGIQR